MRFHHQHGLITLMVAVTLPTPSPVSAADHADTPQLITAGRHDARITDLHVFANGDRLVLSLSTNPNIPPTATSYTFPSDLTVKFHIDRHSRVQFNNAANNAEYGGTITDPRHIRADVTFTVTFDASGNPNLEVDGLRHECDILIFAGLRDDPFIRGPRQGRNIGAVVIELPLSAVVRHANPLLVWATTHVPNITAPFQEHGGRALRSQFVPNDMMNVLTPRQHHRILGLVPDVVIFDPSRPAGYPNGRKLTDDVVNLVGEPATLASDAPFPTANDRPFLTNFPYLATPH